MGVDIRAGLAEFLAVMLFVFFTNGATATGGATPLQFGLFFAALMYVFGQYSGAQMNPALSFGLILAKKTDPVQGVINIVFQVIGGICGAMLICIVVDSQASMMIGTQSIVPVYSAGQAFFAEAMGTMLVMYTVLETAGNANAGIVAPLATGIAVYTAHTFLGSIDGCSINPARTFGPTLVASIGERYNTLVMESSDLWEDHWVFWAGPLAGAAVAVGVNMLMSTILAPKAADAPAEAAGGSE